jgi:hypothetical protein
MIKNPATVEAFEKSQIQADPPDIVQNLRIVSALYAEACLLGAFPLKNPLEGIEADIHLARVINVRTSA